MDDGRLVRVLKALGDPKRFRMIQEIAAAGELSCGRLGEKFPLSQPTISHHLKILGDAGLLVIRQDAQHHFISVNRPLLDEIAALLPGRLAPARRRRSPRERRPASRNP
jgi:DNA-binding transcriptional ArsR family regulator